MKMFLFPKFRIIFTIEESKSLALLFLQFEPQIFLNFGQKTTFLALNQGKKKIPSGSEKKSCGFAQTAQN